jgi:hypothetical protein
VSDTELQLRECACVNEAHGASQHLSPPRPSWAIKGVPGQLVSPAADRVGSESRRREANSRGLLGSYRTDFRRWTEKRQSRLESNEGGF